MVSENTKTGLKYDKVLWDKVNYVETRRDKTSPRHDETRFYEAVLRKDDQRQFQYKMRRDHQDRTKQDCTYKEVLRHDRVEARWEDMSQRQDGTRRYKDIHCKIDEKNQYIDTIQWQVWNNVLVIAFLWPIL